MQSAFGFSSSLPRPLCLGIIVVLTVANLHGVHESGALFAPPTYLYIVMLGCADRGRPVSHLCPRPRPIPLDSLSEEAQQLARQTAPVSMFMLLRAFSSGAVRAVRCRGGVERSAGVPQAREHEQRRRRSPIMGVVLGVGFLGVSLLASHLQPYRDDNDPTGIALMAEYVFGGKNVLFWVIQVATLLILVLAANTAYADFPRLSSIVARDGFLPRQMANRGDRLVFSNGIVFLAGAAAVLIIAFKGNVTALIPLYAFGVFTGFTLSQAGMVVHHFRVREPQLAASAFVNGLGAVATGRRRDHRRRHRSSPPGPGSRRC